MDLLLELLISYPGTARALGRGMVVVSSGLALLALRIDKVFHRLEARGIPHPPLETTLPGWIHWAVPESAFGWILVITMLVGGVVLAMSAKQIQRTLR